jgi:outer membrane protein assembly complex protein YaeT
VNATWRSVGKKTLFIAAVVPVVLALGLALVHLPVVQQHVSQWALARARGAGFVLTADRLRYNLLTLRLRAEGVTVARAGTPREPFVQARTIDVDLPWSAVVKGLSIDSIRLAAVHVTLVRHSDGSTNWSSESSASPSTLTAVSFPIGRLAVTDVALVWRDEVADAALDIPRLSLDLQPTARGAAGKLALEEPGRFAWRGRGAELRGQADASWDGRRLALDAFSLSLPGAMFDASGEIGLLGVAPMLALDYTGRIDLAGSTVWLPLDVPRPTGSVRVDGRVTGPMADLRSAATVTVSDVRWRGITLSSGEMALTADARGIDIDRGSAAIAGGSLAARGRVALGADNLANRMTASWSDIDLGPILTAFDVASAAVPAPRLDGRVTASWNAWTSSDLAMSLEARLHGSASGSQRPRLRGTVSLQTREGRWQAALSQQVEEVVRVEGALAGHLSDERLNQSTVTGHLTASADELPGLLKVLEARGLVPRATASALAGNVSADFEMSGTLGDPRAEGRIKGTNLEYNTFGPATLVGRFLVSTRDAALRDLEVRIGRNTLKGALDAAFQADQLNGEIEADLVTLDDFVADSWPGASGHVSFSGTVAGRLSSPRVDGRIVGERLGIAGQVADRVTGRVTFADQTIAVEKLELTQSSSRPPGAEDGVLTVTGRYHLTTHELSGRVSARALTITPVVERDGSLLAPLAASANGELSVEGTIDDPRGEGRIDLSDLNWADRQLGQASSDLRLSDHRLLSRVRLPDMSASGTVLLDLSPVGPFVADFDVTDADLATLGRRLKIPPAVGVTGVMAVTGHAEGRTDRLTSANVTIDVRRLEGALADVPVRATRAGQARYSPDGLAVDDLTLEVGGTTVHVAGRIGREPGGVLTASIEGSATDITRVMTSIVPRGGTLKPMIDGRVTASVTVSGTMERPVFEGDARFVDGQIGFADFPPATGVALAASYRAGTVDIPTIRGSWQGASVNGSGRFPLTLAADWLPAWALRAVPVVERDGRFTARLDALTPSMLSPWVAPATLSKVSGRSSGTLTVGVSALSLPGVTADLVLDSTELTVAGLRIEAPRPTRLDLIGGWLQVEDWEWRGEGQELLIGGGAQLDQGAALELWVEGRIDWRLIEAFVPRVRTSGFGLLSAQISGTAQTPELSGRFDFENTDIRIASPQIVLSDLQGRLLLSRDQITVGELRGSANGGTLTATGRVGYGGLHLSDGRLAVEAHAVALAVPDPLKTEVDAALSLTIERGTATLGGDVTVLRGSYREPFSIAGGFLQGLQESEMPDEESPSLMGSVVLDVRLMTASDILLDNNYGQMAIGADLRLGGTVARPALVGRAQAREGGRIFLGGNVYQIVDSGAIDFTDTTRIAPEMNISAQTRVSGYDVTLSLKGPPDRLETSLRSTPPLGSSEIVSLLVTGRVQTESGTLPTIGRDQMLAYLSGELFGVAGRSVGLDTLRIEPTGSVRFDAGLIATETNPGSRLTFGKQVTSNVEVVFSHNLKDDGNFTWIVSYRPRRTLELRVVVDDNNDRLYGFRHDITIGGPAPLRPVEAATPILIGSVIVTGDFERPGLSLQQRVSLNTGSKFDFYKWQQDRERLERFCRDSGYFEARVVARRTPRAGAQPATFDLEYAVNLGPRTIVEIPEIPDSSSIRREVERLWRGSAFDALLKEEATKAVRSTLIDQGYVRSNVQTAVSNTEGGEKHLVVRVERGRRSAERKLEFVGNDTVSADQLLAVVRTAGLEATAWVDAMALEDAVGRYYRDAGYLSVLVRVDAPRFDGETANLPVSIAEGPRFRVDRVEVTGVVHVTADQARAAFGVRPGSVYARGVRSQGVRALSDYYRHRGYANAGVSAATRFNRAAGSVTLDVSVEEGPRQVLREVAVEGTHHAKVALVSRELRLDVGKPVDPTQWAEARRRLYDTGVFRQVDLEARPIVEAAATAAPSASDQPVLAQVTVEEWPPLRVRYGFDVDDSLEASTIGRRVRPGVAGDLTYRNVFGWPASAGLAARYTSDFRAVRTFLTTPAFLSRRLTTNLFLGRSREELGSSANPVVTEKNEFTFEQLFRRRPWQIAYGYHFERNHTFNPLAERFDPLAFDATVNIGRLSMTGLIDTRDDLVDATRGQSFSSTFEYGGSALGSDIRYVKQFLQESYYRALGARVVFATSGRLGLARGFGQDLIPSEQFFAGGGNSVRGYGEATLGPVNVLGGTTGGNALLVLNEELRFPIAWRVRGVAFFDAGNAFATVSQIALSELRAGVGLGVRIKTPFALLRLDLGKPLDRRATEPSYKWFASIGQAF